MLADCEKLQEHDELVVLNSKKFTIEQKCAKILRYFVCYSVACPASWTMQGLGAEVPRRQADATKQAHAAGYEMSDDIGSFCEAIQ